MVKKTGNKWSTDKCGLCGKAHNRYSGKLDDHGIEYVICGRTHKRMDVTGKYYRTKRVVVGDKIQFFPTVWTKEQKYADYVQDQFSKLKDYDRRLFEDVANGLVSEGWILNGGSKSFALLSKDDSTIKVFRDVQNPEMVMIRFSAPPEEEE